MSAADNSRFGKALSAVPAWIPSLVSIATLVWAVDSFGVQQAWAVKSFHIQQERTAASDLRSALRTFADFRPTYVVLYPQVRNFGAELNEYKVGHLAPPKSTSDLEAKFDALQKAASAWFSKASADTLIIEILTGKPFASPKEFHFVTVAGIGQTATIDQLIAWRNMLDSDMQAWNHAFATYLKTSKAIAARESAAGED